MKSIFSRMLLISLSTLFLVFFVLTFGLNMTYKNYITQHSKDEMLMRASGFEEYLKTNFNHKMTAIDIEFARQELFRLGKYSDLQVWLVMPDKNLLLADEKISMELIKDEFKAEELSKVLSSQTPVYRESNYSSLPENKYYTLIYPIRLDNNIDLLLFLNKSVPNLNKTIEEINFFAFITIVIVTLYAGITVFTVANRLSGDIKKLNRGVKFVSAGNLEYEFSSDRNDEVGELCKNLNSMAKALRNVEDSRRKFISDLSHDLRSPITLIKGYTSGILDGTIPQEKWDKYLNIVVDEADRLTKLINDILDVSRMQAGNLKLDKSNFDINSLVLDVLDRFEQKIIEKNVTIDMKLYKGILYVTGDKTLIERVIINLVDNAVKFVPDGETIECLTSIKENKVLVGIRNTGIVIPPDKLNSIWERFTKLDSSRGMEKKSSGLGLSIVKEIIDAHGEKIDVYSKEDLGVMFVFSLAKI